MSGHAAQLPAFLIVAAAEENHFLAAISVV
jgi:hypothetical protein